jgi:hypothetical protein
MHIQKGTTLNIFDDTEVDLKQIWYQDMEHIHGSIQLEVFVETVIKFQFQEGRWMTIGSSRATTLSTDSQWMSWSVSYLWTTVIKSQQNVSLQWFQYHCDKTFHSLWVASLVHIRSLGSNRQQWQERIC